MLGLSGHEARLQTTDSHKNISMQRGWLQTEQLWCMQSTSLRHFGNFRMHSAADVSSLGKMPVVTLIWISAYAPRRRGEESPLALPDTPEVKLPTDLLGPQGFSELARANGLKSLSLSDTSALTMHQVIVNTLSFSTIMPQSYHNHATIIPQSCHSLPQS